MHARGVPLTVVRAACTQGSIDCLDYALNNNCPFDADICEATGTAVQNKLECLIRMHSHGAALTSVVVEVTAYNDYATH